MCSPVVIELGRLTGGLHQKGENISSHEDLGPTVQSGVSLVGPIAACHVCRCYVATGPGRCFMLLGLMRCAQPAQYQWRETICPRFLIDCNTVPPTRSTPASKARQTCTVHTKGNTSHYDGRFGARAMLNLRQCHCLVFVFGRLSRIRLLTRTSPNDTLNQAESKSEYDADYGPRKNVHAFRLLGSKQIGIPDLIHLYLICQYENQSSSCLLPMCLLRSLRLPGV
ncbi:hypothetical protein KCU88_g339, partial [Aureobasidium melanogenum]